MRKNQNKTVLNFWLNIIILVALLILYEEHETGQVIHEWLGVSLAFGLIVHILFHLRWLLCIVKNFFSKLSMINRMKFILNLLIFMSFCSIIYSGLMMSENILPVFGVQTFQHSYWRGIHFITVDITIWLVALHFALNWKKIVQIIRNGVIPIFKPSSISTPLIKVKKSIRFSIRKENEVFKYFTATLLILLFSGIISLAWYSLSGSTLAANFRTSHNRTENRDYKSIDQSQNPHNHFNRRFNRSHDNPTGHFNTNHESREGLSLLRAIPGITKNIIIISLVTGIVFIAGKGLKTKRKDDHEIEN